MESEDLVIQVAKLAMELETMDSNQQRERQETNRLMEKLIDGQQDLGEKMAARNAFDISTGKRMDNLEGELKEFRKIQVRLLTDNKANTDMRLDIVDRRRRIFGIVAAILIAGSLLAYSFSKG